MSQEEKSRYFQALKAAGVQFDKHYRDYTTEDLKQAYDRLMETQPPPADAPVAGGNHELPPIYDEQPGVDPDDQLDDVAAAFFGLHVGPEVPRQAEPDPTEMAGQRSHSKADDEPIRVDESGRVWYQEEIRKPGSPQPRARRVLKYIESGTETRTVQTRDEQGRTYIESFEIAGQGQGREAEVKITMPSYQTGIFRDPRFPMFKVHVYNDVQGFDLFDVHEFYGGAELVPPICKRFYVANDLCYDIRSVVQAIEAEDRQNVLQGKYQGANQ